MKLSWTAVYDGMCKNGDGKNRGGKHLDSQGQKGSTAEIIYLRVAR
jgi:hypothetical protein